jgi:hypothetical protein
MKFERFINIMKWVSAVSITIALVVSVAVMAGYLGWGYEPIPIIHFAIVFSILSIFVCMFYFVLCAVDHIRAWRQKKRKEANKASFF